MSDKHSFGRIEINKLVSTIILGTSFSTILLFGLIFYMYFDPKSGYTFALNEAFSVTASFFGGVTTLVAAYIASQLFNDWREIHNKTTYKEICNSIFSTQTKLNVKLISINDIFTEAKNKFQISPTQYDTDKISEIIQSDVQEVGNLLVELLYQITYIQKLNQKFKDKTIGEFENLLIDYIALMDISKYRVMKDHLEFLEQEKKLKKRWDNIEVKFLDLLAAQTISKL